MLLKVPKSAFKGQQLMKELGVAAFRPGGVQSRVCGHSSSSGPGDLGGAMSASLYLGRVTSAPAPEAGVRTPLDQLRAAKLLHVRTEYIVG